MLRMFYNSTSCDHAHDGIAVAVDMKTRVPTGYSYCLDASKCLKYSHGRVFQVDNDVCLFLYSSSCILHLITSIRGGSSLATCLRVIFNMLSLF